MTVYLEYIFLDNLSINMFILYLTLLAKKYEAKWLRIFLSASLGAVFSAIYPFINNYNYVVKVLLAVFMVLILKKYDKIKDYFGMLITFYLISFSLAGAVVMISSFTAVDLTNFDTSLQLFPFCICTSCLILLILIKFAIKDFYRRKNISRLIYPAKVTANGKDIEINAFYDSGNQLYDPSTNCPVVIISEKLYEKLKGGEEGEIEICTVGGIKCLKTISISLRIYFDNKVNKMYITKAGVSDDFKKDYDMILHTEMIGE